jgi:Ni/Fe-hydrogenase subunit HybB-like protein
MLFGLAFTVLVLVILGPQLRQDLLTDEMVGRFRGLLAVFSLTVLYFTAVHHLTKLYASEHYGIERFLLLDGGAYTTVFWLGQIVIGSLLPLVILALPSFGRTRSAITIASLLFLLGGLAQIYVIIIGGQAYPLNLFPGMHATSSFHDGEIARYAPSLPEIFLGLSGISIAMLLTGIAIKLLPFLPRPVLSETAG